MADPDTRDWTDGLLSNIFRDINKPLAADHENDRFKNFQLVTPSEFIFSYTNLEIYDSVSLKLTVENCIKSSPEPCRCLKATAQSINMTPSIFCFSFRFLQEYMTNERYLDSVQHKINIELIDSLF